MESRCCCSASSPCWSYTSSSASRAGVHGTRTPAERAGQFSAEYRRFVATNTNWQSYVPEATMSYLTQMAGLAYHNFASAAVGIALAIAFSAVSAVASKITSATSGSMPPVQSCGCCCPFPSSSPWRLFRKVWCRTCIPTAPHTWWNRKGVTQDSTGNPPPNTSPRKPSLRDRWRRRKPSKCWERMVAGFSIPTRPSV